MSVNFNKQKIYLILTSLSQPFAFANVHCILLWGGPSIHLPGAKFNHPRYSHAQLINTVRLIRKGTEGNWGLQTTSILAMPMAEVLEKAESSQRERVKGLVRERSAWSSSGSFRQQPAQPRQSSQVFVSAPTRQNKTGVPNIIYHLPAGCLQCLCSCSDTYSATGLLRIFDDFWHHDWQLVFPMNILIMGFDM